MKTPREHIESTMPSNDDTVSPGTTADILPAVEPENYEIRGEIARGAAGRVLHAWDNLFKRPVAIKELLPEASERGVRRFLREALVTARLQHPGIVPVYQAGRWPNGAPFYAMKMIGGRSLADILHETATLPERLALLPNVFAVAETIAYVHAQGIIHRDIKPSNILIGEFGETLLADWGLTKDLRGPEEAFEPDMNSGLTTARATQQGTVLGTPAYMPPEQANGEDADRPADVYAIGAVLYHVLTGVPPHDGKNALETLVMVMAGPPAPLAKVAPGVPSDLVAIVEKAMAREPSDRYPSGKALAEDLRRFMTGQLVRAQRYTRAALFARWLKRHLVTVTVAVVGLFALTGILTASFLRIQQERDRSELARNAAEAARTRETARADELVLVQARHMLDVDPTQTIAWLQKLSRDTDQLTAARMIAEDARQRGVARIVRSHGDRVYRTVFSPDGRRFATWGGDRRVRIWNGEGGLVHEIRDIGAIADAGGGELAYSTTGDALMARLGGRIILFDPGSGEIRFETGPVPEDEQDPAYRAVSNDGRRVAIGSRHGLVLIDTATNRRETLIGTALSEPPWPFFAPSGARLGAVTDLGIRVFDLEPSGAKRQRLLKVPADVHRARFSPGGKTIACSSKVDGKIRLFDVETGQGRALEGHSDSVRSFVFSPKGGVLASAGSFDRTVRVWDLATGRSRAFAERDPTLMEFSPDGTRIALVLLTRVEIIDLTTGDTTNLNGHQEEISAFAFSPDGRTLVTGGFDGSLRTWELNLGPERSFGGSPDAAFSRFALSGDGHHLSATTREGRRSIRDLEIGAWTEGPPAFASAFAQDGAELIAREDGAVMRSKDQSDDWTVRLTGLHVSPGADLSFSPKGSFVAVTRAASREIEIGDLASGAVARIQTGDGGGVRAIAWCGDESCFVSGDGDGNVRMRARLTGTVLATFEAHQEQISSVAITADAHLIASGDVREIRLFDVASRASRVLVGHERGFPISSLAFSPSGRLLASTAQDSSARLWDVASGEGRPLRRASVVLFARDREPSLLVTAGQDGAISLWRETLPWDRGELVRQLAEMNQTRM